MGEQEVDQEKESLKENLAGAQAGLDRANQNLENHLKTSPDNTFFDAYNQNVQEYKASHETPEQAAARQRDQRNAAMWTAVTDGINHIFNLTNASTNKNAVPMQTVSTSQAIQKSAKENDERYEKSQEKLMEMNRNLDSMRMGRYSLASDNLSKLRDIHAQQVANAQGRLDKHNEGVRSQRDFDEGVRQFNENLKDREKGRNQQSADAAASRATQVSINNANIASREKMNAEDNQNALDRARLSGENGGKKKFTDSDYDTAIGRCTEDQRSQIESIIKRDTSLAVKKNNKMTLSPEKILEIKRNAINSVNPSALGAKTSWEY